jgi:hypothetical protein
MSSIMGGNELNFFYTGDELRKGISELASPNAPLDDIFLLDVLLDKAHYRDHLPESGEAPILGFFLDAGAESRTIANYREC